MSESDFRELGYIIGCIRGVCSGLEHRTEIKDKEIKSLHEFFGKLESQLRDLAIRQDNAATDKNL